MRTRTRNIILATAIAAVATGGAAYFWQSQRKSADESRASNQATGVEAKGDKTLSKLYLPSVEKDCPSSEEKNCFVAGLENMMTATKVNYAVTDWGFADAGWFFDAHLVSDAHTGDDLLYYQMSNTNLVWHNKGGTKHELSTKADRPWSDFQDDIGASNPVKVLSFVLDGKELKILPSAVQFEDGGPGGFQDARFTANNTYTGGDLIFGSQIYEVDFVNSTVKLKR